MSDNQGIRVLLVDDQELIRQGIQLLLDLEDDMLVVGDVGTSEDAVAFAKEQGVDVVLMDVRMPGMGGIEATRLIREHHPQTKVLILTTFEDETYLFEGLTAGASGYLLKDTSSEHLTLAIRSVANGSGFLQPEAVAKVVAAYKHLANEPKRRDEANRSLPSPLTQREQEILAYIVTESTNREIAEALFLTEGTVKNYVTSILSKLDVSDRQSARLKAKELGLV